MRYGHFMGYGYYGAPIFLIILTIAIVIFIIFIRSSRKTINSQFKRLLEILRERYVRDEITAEEFREKRMIIEDENTPDPELLFLMERYVKGEISSKDYFEKKESLHNNVSNSAIEILNERYEKGEISIEEYEEIKKEII